MANATEWMNGWHVSWGMKVPLQKYYWKTATVHIELVKGMWVGWTTAKSVVLMGASLIILMDISRIECWMSRAWMTINDPFVCPFPLHDRIPTWLFTKGGSHSFSINFKPQIQNTWEEIQVLELLLTCGGGHLDWESLPTKGLSSWVAPEAIHASEIEGLAIVHMPVVICWWLPNYFLGHPSRLTSGLNWWPTDWLTDWRRHVSGHSSQTSSRRTCRATACAAAALVQIMAVVDGQFSKWKNHFNQPRELISLRVRLESVK